MSPIPGLSSAAQSGISTPVKGISSEASTQLLTVGKVNVNPMG